MSNPAQHPTTNEEIVGGRVRRAPRYGAFLVVGAIVGVLAALILTFVYNGTRTPSELTNVSYSQGQVFGFLALVLGTVGVLIGGIVALVIDRTIGRRSRSVVVDHETVQLEDDVEPEPMVLNQVDPPTSLGTPDQAPRPSTTPPDAPRP
ncbi:MAG TPA: potassium transporter Trk [Microbacterium sp.]|nr:potassium transporter Trk [Microbacterium sp.]